MVVINMPAGRPTKYKPEYAEQAYKLCLLGATDIEMADFFEVAESTLYLWKKEHPEFSEALKKGKMQADAVIAQKLYHRAKGYEHPEDKIFFDKGEPIVVPTIKHYPPDTRAAIFWLKNRQPDKWRDKQEQDISVKEMPDIIIKRAD
jgi:transposase-like protein